MHSESQIMKTQGKQLGFIIVALGLVMFLWTYIGDPTFLFDHIWISVVYQWLLPIGLAIYAVAQGKKQLGGYISYKSALGISAIGLILGTAVVVLFNALMYNVIDPDFKALMEEKSIEFTIGFLERMNATEEQMAEAIEQLKERDQLGFRAQMMGMVFMSIYYLVVSLIVAAAMKKDNPEGQI